jgi:UDP-glucose 4-epimerase
MDLRNATVLVTGAAGLIGSAMCRELADETRVIAVDDFSKGRREWLPDGVEVREADLTDAAETADAITGEADVVCHFAARSDAADGDSRSQFTDNVEMLYNVLERMDEVGCRAIAAASSSAVYGAAPRPTPEDYAPLEPESEYGASKLAGEGLLSTYAHSYDFRVWQFRFANVVGPHQRDNVVPDFVEKLLADPETLTILGNGRQEKSYVHVEDCVDAIEHVVREADGDGPRTYNVGTRTTITVTRIADVVSDVMGLDPDYEYTGGERGWTGDIPKMRLSVEKITALGWEASMESEAAVRRAAEEMYAELGGEEVEPRT